MNGTPRLRSAYPTTPRSAQRDGRSAPASEVERLSTAPLEPKSISARGDGPQPLVPFTVLDAPSQRLYASAFYLGITAWRIWDYSGLVSTETDSLWLFMKWVLIDGVFLYSLPSLRIPWMEWSSSTMTLIFVTHAALNAILMFRIPVRRPEPVADLSR